jgi:hypothetical protein
VTVTLDARTRRDHDVRDVDVADFFDEELPALARERSHLAVPGARELAVEPFTFGTPVGDWTLAVVGDAVVVTRGDAGAARVELDVDEVSRLVDDRMTPMTLVAASAVRSTRGDLGDFLDWWVVLRALIDGRPAHTAGAIGFLDRDGAPLDLARSFTPDDDDAEIAHFLGEAGFLHLRGWFATDEMDEISADIDRVLPTFRPDDGRSWWARTAGGEHRAVRLQGFEQLSPTTAALVASDRFARIGRLTSDGHVAAGTVEALEKPIGVVEGISDLPWHKDCSLGMHSYTCSGMTVGISVTGAGATSGQLAVVPGTHRVLVQPAFHRREWGLPPRPLPTDTGDVTVHCSCTMHMSHAPRDRERRVLYTSFRLPPLDPSLAEHQVTIRDVREGAYKKVDQPTP